MHPRFPESRVRERQSTNVTRPRPLPTELPSSFSTAEALAAGVTPRRLRAKDLASPFRGTRRRLPEDRATRDTRSDADDTPYADDAAHRADHLSAMRMFATVMESGTFFSGRTAAYAYGVPLDPGDALEVATFAPRRAPLRRGIRGRKVAPHLATVRMHEGMPVSSPASTWAMLATELTERELVVVGDALVRIPRDRFGRQHPELRLATIEHLQSAVDAGPRPGRPKLRAALAMIRVGSSSPLETEYRLDADAAGLPTPSLDREIRDDRGRLLGISEIVYEEYRVVVEIEGDHHRTSRRQWHRDIEKYRDYADAGWHVVRLTSSHLRPARIGLSIVAQALQNRGWNGRLGQL